MNTADSQWIEGREAGWSEGQWQSPVTTTSATSFSTPSTTASEFTNGIETSFLFHLPTRRQTCQGQGSSQKAGMMRKRILTGSLNGFSQQTKESYLALRIFLVRWVQEDPSIDQGAVHVSHHGAHIPGPIGSTAILEGREERDKMQWA